LLVEIRELDGRDVEELRRFWEIGKAAEAACRPYDFYVSWEGALSRYQHGRVGSRQTLFGAYDGATMLGRVLVSYPELDNTHLATAEVSVHPDQQRRGIGRLLVDETVRRARSEGRRVLLCDAYSPLDEESGPLRFGRALGFAPAIEDVMKVVDLVETEPTWEALDREARQRGGGYRLVSWTDTVPAEHLDGYCLLNQAFNDESPTGDLDLEPETWDERRVRGREEQDRAVRRRHLAVGAVAGDGTLAGLTEIVVSDHAPHHGFQSGTLVLPEHRGHALGLAMKVANHRQVRAAFPECRVLVTGNAGINAAMNAVNDRLGYRAIERCVELQREL
jgi:GNAT superfamily N-acetyltransferase